MTRDGTFACRYAHNSLRIRSSVFHLCIADCGVPCGISTGRPRALAHSTTRYSNLHYVWRFFFAHPWRGRTFAIPQWALNSSEEQAQRGLRIQTNPHWSVKETLGAYRSFIKILRVDERLWSLLLHYTCVCGAHMWCHRWGVSTTQPSREGDSW